MSTALRMSGCLITRGMENPQLTSGQYKRPAVSQ
jgi:hypothetical protein